MPRRGSWRGSLPTAANIDPGSKEARIVLPAISVATLQYQIFEDVYDQIGISIFVQTTGTLSGTLKLQQAVTTSDPYVMINFTPTAGVNPSTVPYGEQSFGTSPFPALPWVDIAGASTTINFAAANSQNIFYSVYPFCANMININFNVTAATGTNTWLAWMSRKCSGGNN